MLRLMGERVGAVPVTLCFVRAGKHILLLRSAVHKDRFRGLWNGLGGHVRSGEDVRAAARRELLEESGLEPRQLRLRAVIHETGLLGRDHLLFVFTAHVDEREAERTPPSIPEGELAWFQPDEIPWAEAVPDLCELLPRVLEGDELLFGSQEFDGSDRPLRFCLS